MPDEPRGRVLCVDDDLDAVLSLTTLLSLHGFAARAARGGRQALTLSTAFRPTTCVINLRMPGMDGFELAGRLRTLIGPGVVLVAVSGLTEDDVAARATAAGFGWLFPEPVDPDDLLGALAVEAATHIAEHSIARKRSNK